MIKKAFHSTITANIVLVFLSLTFIAACSKDHSEIPPSETPIPPIELPARWTSTPTTIFVPTATFTPTPVVDPTEIRRLPTRTPKPTPWPTSGPTEDLRYLCEPFPDEIHYYAYGGDFCESDWSLYETCKGKVIHTCSPVDHMALLDYTPLTGRFAYISRELAGGALWIYDYWTETSENWSDTQATKAEWFPIKDEEGKQKLAILDGDGNLILLSGPFKSSTIATNISHFSLSPKGDRIAYVKEESLYVVPIRGGQPRKLADQVYGTPAWALEHNAIIAPSSPMKIVKLDGSDVIIPEEMPYITKRIRSSELGGQVLWDERSRLVVFTIKINGPTDIYPLFVYELSDDLNSIVNQKFITMDTDRYGIPYAWKIPGTTILSPNGRHLTVTLESDFFTVEGRISSIGRDYLGVEFVYDEPNLHYFVAHFSNVVIDDQTMILDKNGNIIATDGLEEGMTIQLTARRLQPNTLSLYAYNMIVLCDEENCSLKIEGYSGLSYFYTEEGVLFEQE
jgi:hypothetical protein